MGLVLNACVPRVCMYTCVVCSLPLAQLQCLECRLLTQPAVHLLQLTDLQAGHNLQYIAWVHVACGIICLYASGHAHMHGCTRDSSAVNPVAAERAYKPESMHVYMWLQPLPTVASSLFLCGCLG